MMFAQYGEDVGFYSHRYSLSIYVKLYEVLNYIKHKVLLISF